MKRHLDAERAQLLKDGIQLVEAFCKHNRIKTPPIKIATFRDHCGLFTRKDRTIHIDPFRCARIGRGGMAWSYPGYKVDRTPYGVLAHELGHVFDSEILWHVASGEAPLTGYCPNDREWFAEMFRLFCTNPMLLRALRPATFDLLAARFKPLHRKRWSTVLKGAPRQLAFLHSKLS